MIPLTQGLLTRGIDVVAAAQMACLLEVGAPKPGNVSPGRPFRDAGYEDFVASALAIGEPLRSAMNHPVGVSIRLAIEATRAWTTANTNLGIVLLLVPLVKAAAANDDWTTGSGARALRGSLERLLLATTVQDTRDVYSAIRAAAPGGLGSADREDVNNEPTVTLLEAMRLAAHRDTIAQEYVTSFETTFTVGVPALENARRDGLPWNDAIVETYLVLLASAPDTHIRRRAGDAAASDVTRAARAALDAGGVRTGAGRHAIALLDDALREPGSSRNPGTSADLTCASLFVVLALGGWHAAERIRA